MLNADENDLELEYSILQISVPSLDIQSSMLNDILLLISEANNLGNLCRIGMILIESLNIDVHEKNAILAINKIFKNFKDNEEALNFALRLIQKLPKINVSFDLLFENPITFPVISFAVKNKENLYALIALDKNIDKSISICWNVLANEKTYSILKNACDLLVYFSQEYQSLFTIQLDKCWNLTSIKNFILNSSQLPVSLIIISQKKEYQDDDILRLLLIHSYALLNDIKKTLIESDQQFSKFVIMSLENLVLVDPSLFISGIKNNQLIEVISFL